MNAVAAVTFVITLITFIVGALFGSAYRDHIRDEHDEQKQIREEIEKGKEAYYRILERLEALEIITKK